MQSICPGRMGESARGGDKWQVVSCRQPGTKHQAAWVGARTPAARSPAVKQGQITAHMMLNSGTLCGPFLLYSGSGLDPRSGWDRALYVLAGGGGWWGGLVRKGRGGALPAQIRRLPLPALMTFMTSSLESTGFQERETRFKSRLCYMEIKPKK